MSLYFLLGTLSAAGQKLVHDDRNLLVKSTREIQIRGAEILGQYAVLGRYDFVMMVEADNNDSVARLSRAADTLPRSAATRSRKVIRLSARRS
ncbi:MAG: GYD domain-containing protein [Chloroflexi bacterium]|nr:GYD domain-containing protein [Chloroflexota bacterium]